MTFTDRNLYTYKKKIDFLFETIILKLKTFKKKTIVCFGVNIKLYTNSS